jgi:hypothetical protein
MMPIIIASISVRSNLTWPIIKPLFAVIEDGDGWTGHALGRGLFQRS